MASHPEDASAEFIRRSYKSNQIIKFTLALANYEDRFKVTCCSVSAIVDTCRMTTNHNILLFVKTGTNYVQHKHVCLLSLPDIWVPKSE